MGIIFYQAFEFVEFDNLVKRYLTYSTVRPGEATLAATWEWKCTSCSKAILGIARLKLKEIGFRDKLRIVRRSEFRGSEAWIPRVLSVLELLLGFRLVGIGFEA